MIRLTQTQLQPIGIDIGHDAVRMLQLETVGQTLSVVAAVHEPLPDDARNDPQLRLPAAVELVRQMMRQGGFHGRHVTATLPREIVHMKSLRLPPMPAGDLAAAVQFEARGIFPFEIEQAQVQYLPAGEIRQGGDVRQELIVVAARNQDVGDFLEHLHRCGVVVESLDVEACALFRGIERFIRRREDEQEVYVLLDVGLRQSQVIIGRGRDISFCKQIEIGGQHFHEAVSRKLGITADETQALRRRLAEPAAVAADGKRDPVRQAVFDATRGVMEELARELALCLRYHSVTFRGQRPGRVRVVGGGGCDPVLLGVLNGALPIPAEAGRPLYSVDTSRMNASYRRGPMSEWALAFGLGLRFTQGHFGPRDGKPRDEVATSQIGEGTATDDAAAGPAVQPGSTTGAAETPHWPTRVLSAVGTGTAGAAREKEVAGA